MNTYEKILAILESNASRCCDDETDRQALAHALATELDETPARDCGFCPVCEGPTVQGVCDVDRTHATGKVTP